MPKFLSADAQDLISKILNTDPTKRFRISDIRDHPWHKLVSYQKISGGIFIGLSQIPINTRILSLLCKKKKKITDEGQAENGAKRDDLDDLGEIDTQLLPHNFDYKKDYVVRCLNANKHNHITTSYYLLLKKYQDIQAAHSKTGGPKSNIIRPEDFRYFDAKAVEALVAEQKREELAEKQQQAKQAEPSVSSKRDSKDASYRPADLAEAEKQHQESKKNVVRKESKEKENEVEETAQKNITKTQGPSTGNGDIMPK